MANRINKNLRWVKRQLDLAKVHDVLEEEILEQLSLAELEICERTGHLKQTDVITFDSAVPAPPVDHSNGIYAVPPGVDRITYIAYPTAWTRPLQVTEDPKTFDDIQKENISGTSPLVVLVRNYLMTFWPKPTDGDQITLYSFRAPKTDGSEAQVESGAGALGDPIIDFHWDMAMRKMALSELIGGDWIDKAKTEYDREAAHHFQETGMPMLIDHSSRRLGF